MGGTQNSVGENNEIYVSGSAFAAVIYEVESDGDGAAFPTPHTNLTLQNNDIFLNGGSSRGFSVRDNAGGRSGSYPTKILNNHFYLNGGTASVYAVDYVASAVTVVVQGNDVNGTNVAYADPKGNGDIISDPVYDEVQTISSTAIYAP